MVIYYMASLLLLWLRRFRRWLCWPRLWCRISLYHLLWLLLSWILIARLIRCIMLLQSLWWIWQWSMQIFRFRMPLLGRYHTRVISTNVLLLLNLVFIAEEVVVLNWIGCESTIVIVNSKWFLRSKRRFLKLIDHFSWHSPRHWSYPLLWVVML